MGTRMSMLITKMVQLSLTDTKFRTAKRNAGKRPVKGKLSNC